MFFSQKDKYFVLFIGVLIIAIILRLPYISSGYSAIEAETIIVSQAFVTDGSSYIGSLLMLANEKHMPFDYFLRGLWGFLFGFSALAQRIYALLFSIASVVMVGKTGSLLFGKKTGLLASFFMAIFPSAILYGAEVRMYALFIFLSICSFYLLIKSL